MKRRHLLPALAAAPAILSPSATAQTAASFALTWRDIYAKHWRNERDYTLQVLDAMPADGFDFKPNPVQRNFGDQLRHLAFANVVYFNQFKLVPIPSPPLAANAKALDEIANPTDKEAVRKFVAASFDYVSSVLEKLTEAELTATGYTIRDPHTGTDVLLRAYTHTAHHRGQAIVYLRARNIAPPTWKFEPA
jgi:uncharacterized damage-inducible protein DinB